MDPVSLVVVVVVASLAAGFGAGWGLKPDSAEKALAEQARILTSVQEGQAKILAEASRPVVLDGELRASLAQMPAQCLRSLGGDPRAIECQWATCLQFGQSAANRPECRAVEAAMLDALRDGCRVIE
jgi:hypothetical protein